MNKNEDKNEEMKNLSLDLETNFNQTFDSNNQIDYKAIKSPLIKTLMEKNLFNQCTNLNLLDELTLSDKKITAYIGFDCTAKSLHIGNMIQIMILKLLQDLGHRPIVLLGGATSQIGDPTGKDKMRKVLTNEEIEENTIGIKKSLSKFIKFAENNQSDNFSDALLLNNNTWLSQLNYIDFLRDFGSKISINRMLSRDIVKNRLNAQKPLSLLEFNYMICQGYDFYHLHKNYNCVLQIGGSDQWVNIITGVEMIGSDKVIGLTTKLLTNNSGEKMGKTVNGAIWLNEEMCSSFDYFQYWRNISDQDVLKFAAMFSNMNKDELDNLANISLTNINEAKKILAFHLTYLCHGEMAAKEALDKTVKLFEQKNANLDNLHSFTLEHLPILIIDILVQSDLVQSKKQAKDLITNGGVMLNDIKILDISYMVTAKDFEKSENLKLTLGKKRHLILKTLKL